MSTLQEIRDAISSSHSVVVAAHISPDSDAVGSSVGLARLLSSIGKDAVTYLYDRIPERVLPLVKDSKVISQTPSMSFDLLIAVDTATKERLGKSSDELFKFAKKTIVLDHHISNPGYGDLNFIDATSASSASIVLRLGKLLNAKFDKVTLNLLFAGLMDDTGSFRFGNTDERVFLEAAELVRLGAEVEKVSEQLYFSSPLRYLKLQSKVVESIELIAGSQIAFGSISVDDLKTLNCKKEDTDGMIDLLRSVEGTKGAVFLRELTPTSDSPNKWKASIRNKQGSFDANKVATTFGGGGHIAAAGCTINLHLDEAKKLIEAAILKALG